MGEVFGRGRVCERNTVSEIGESVKQSLVFG